MQRPATEQHAEIRDAVRALCADFPDEYHREIDAERAYPEAFVAALTQAGWLAALIPQEYGGAGLGLAEASVIMEEINRSGGNAGACHGQMYNMGTLLRHGSERQKQFYLPKIASGEWRLQSMGVTEPGTGTDTTKIKTPCGQEGRPLRRQRPEGLDLARAALGLDDPARPHDAAGAGDEEVGRDVDLHGRPAPGREVGPERAADREHGQPRDQRALLREPRDPPGAADRPGGPGLSLHPRRAERRAHADRGRVHRRRPLVHRPRDGLREGPHPVRPPDRAEPGRAVPDRRCLHRSRGGRPDAMERHPVRPARAVRRAGQHGQVPGGEGQLGGGERRLQFHGGFGFACGYDVERKFRETRLYQVAPISTNMVYSYIAEHVLGLPRSY